MEGNDTSDRSDCNTSISISSSEFYRGVLIGECVFGTLAIAPNVLLLSVVWRAKVMSANLRLLLGYLSFVFVWFGVGDAAKCVYSLTTDPCSYSLTMRQCRLLDLATTWLTLPNIYYSLIPLCIERVYATINYRTYEISSVHQKPWLAIVLITCAATTAIMINGRTVFLLPQNVYVPICDSAFVPSMTMNHAMQSIYLGLEAAASAATMFLYYYNRRIATSMAINRARYDLSARFQIDQNVQINSIIIPSMILHFIYHLPTFTFSMFISTMVDCNIGTKVGLMRLTILWRLIYALVHPILLFRINTHLKYHLIKGAFGKALRRVGVDLPVDKDNTKAIKAPNTVTIVHFQYLDQMWARVKKTPGTGPVGQGQAKTKANGSVP